MNLEDRINLLHRYREAALAWKDADNSQTKAAIRASINKNTQAVKREVQEAGCYKKFTTGPPPAVGNGICLRK